MERHLTLLRDSHLGTNEKIDLLKIELTEQQQKNMEKQKDIENAEKNQQTLASKAMVFFLRGGHRFDGGHRMSPPPPPMPPSKHAIFLSIGGLLKFPSMPPSKKHHE